MHGHSLQNITMTLLVFLTIFEVIDIGFILKYPSGDKYFVRCSVESEIKSQVVTVPKVPT